MVISQPEKSDAMPWGKPDNERAKTLISSFTQSVELALNKEQCCKIQIANGTIKKSNLFDPYIRLVLDDIEFEKSSDGDSFFDGCDGLRGHYYASPEAGDEYSSKCLAAVADALTAHMKVRKAQLLSALKADIDKKMEDPDFLKEKKQEKADWSKVAAGKFDYEKSVTSSIKNGKIWGGGAAADPLFEKNGTQRWTEENVDANCTRFREYIKQEDDKKQEKDKSDYGPWQIELRANMGISRNNNLTFIVVGGFVCPTADNKLWVAPDKLYRKHQIHHLGFT